MDKNFLLAFLLSTIAIFGYYTLFPPQEPDRNPPEERSAISEESTETGAAPAVRTVVETEKPDASRVVLASRKTISVDNTYYIAEIDTQDGTLASFKLKNHKYSSEPHFDITEWFLSLFTGKEVVVREYDPERLINMAGDISAKNLIWRVSDGISDEPVNFHSSRDRVRVGNTPETITLEATLASGLDVSKTLVFHPDSYMIDMEVGMANQTGERLRLAPRINFGAGNESVMGESLPKPKIGFALYDDDFEKYDDDDFEKVMKLNPASWAGIMDTYFVSVVRMTDKSDFKGEMAPLDSVLNGDDITIPKVEYVDAVINLGPNQQYVRNFQLFVGPKVQTELEKFDINLIQSMDLGWFAFLAHPMLSILRWIQTHVMNWGIAIICLTIVVRLAMFPLAFKGMTSMKKMSALNPQIKEIRDKHKGNKERMNKEVMEFYKKNKVNPVGGCLPMALQMPIFIALYYALMPAIELRHSPFFFFWDDLSAADYTLILPILMGAAMFLQQSITPNPAMDATQAKMMKWMPVLMVFFFFRLPSGLVLYWVISNTLTIGQQIIFNKVRPIKAEEIIVKSKAKTGGKAKGKSRNKGKGKSKGK